MTSHVYQGKVRQHDINMVAALSTFFLPITSNMAPKPTIKPSPSKLTNIMAKKGKDVRPVVSSDDSSDDEPKIKTKTKSKGKKTVVLSSSEDSSDDEPKKKTKTKAKKSKAKKVESSSEDSSDDEPEPKKKTKGKKTVQSSSEEDSDDDGVPLDDVKLKTSTTAPIVVSNDMTKVADGLLAIALQMAVSNENNAKVLALLGVVLSKMEERAEKANIMHHLHDAHDTYGAGVHDVEADLIRDAGKIASVDNFIKEDDEVDETQ